MEPHAQLSHPHPQPHRRLVRRQMSGPSSASIATDMQAPAETLEELQAKKTQLTQVSAAKSMLFAKEDADAIRASF